MKNRKRVTFLDEALEAQAQFLGAYECFEMARLHRQWAHQYEIRARVLLADLRPGRKSSRKLKLPKTPPGELPKN